jgi:hypothetical protein
LILDSTQTQIEDGHTPLVEPSESSGGTSDLTAYRENSLLLADVKKLVKAPGQTVRSIGATSTTDREGVDWLVVSNTGSPPDDVDLIDFDNGLQGQRIYNSLSTLKNLSEIADAGGTAQAEARTNLAMNVAVSGFVAASTVYTAESQAPFSQFIVDTAIAAGVWESIGPTGEGADNDWAALDDVPDNAKFIDIMIELNVNVSSVNGLLTVNSRKVGEADAADSRTTIASSSPSATGANMETATPARIAIVDRKFDLTYSVSSVSGETIKLILRGFGVQ